MFVREKFGRAARLVASGVLVTAVTTVSVLPATAAVPAVLSESDCDAILTGTADIADSQDLEAGKPAALEDAAKTFTSTAKQVDDAKVKKALKTIAKTMSRASKAGSPAEVAKKLANRSYTGAITTWTSEAVSCEAARTSET